MSPVSRRPPDGPVDLHKLYPPTQDPTLENYFRSDDRWTELVAIKLNQMATAGAGTITGVTAGTGLVGGGTSGAVTVSLAVPVAIANGGTAATTAGGALTNLGAAPLASPALTGTPTAPTATAGTNTTQLATTAFVQAAIPTVAGVYLPLAGGTMTGAIAMGANKITGLANGTVATDGAAYGQVPVASSTTPGMDGTAAVGTGTTWARADHVHPTDTSRAPLASPTFTGTPAAPTATAGTSTTQLATTAFVQTALGGYVPLNLTPQQIAFGAASGGGIAQDAQLLWDTTNKILAAGIGPSIWRSQSASNVANLTLNAKVIGGVWSFDDTTKEAFDFTQDQVNHWYGFFWAPPSANPPVWQKLAQLDSTGRWSTAGAHRFRHLVTAARMALTVTAAMTADSAFHAIPWNSTVYDPDAIGVSSTFVPAVTGYYHVTLSLSQSGATTQFLGSIFVAGAEVARGAWVNVFGGTVDYEGLVTAGQTVSFQYYQFSGGTAGTMAANLTWATICYIGE